MTETVFESPQSMMPAKRFDIPVKWGFIIGIIGIIMITVENMFLIKNYYMFMGGYIVIFIITVILYGIVGGQQRKAMGGYISFKDAFQAIFVAILISVSLTTIYSIIYVKLIDPGMMDKIKETTLAFMESMKVPQDKIDKTAADFDT